MDRARTWKRHSVEEIVGKLEQAGAAVMSGASIEEAATAVGITLATYFRWRKQYSGLRVSQLRYIKELEIENGRLRRAMKEIENGAFA